MKELNFMRITKSELCPCGSGKKYKSCCFNAKDKDINEDKMIENERWLNSFIMGMYKETDYEECIYYDKNSCKGQIIGAHTLQNNGVLTKLSEKNHVFMIKPKVDKYGGKADFEKVGRNKATTFMGFCKEHDDKIFAEIEKEGYMGTEKQKFLYAYRAFAQEYHKKERLMKSMQASFKLKPSMLKSSFIVSNYRYRQLEMFDINEYKRKFDEAFRLNEYSLLETIEIVIENEYDFAVTSMFTLITDLENNLVNDSYSKKFERMKSCFITVVPINNKTLILISWLKEDNEIFKNYKRQIENLNEDELKNYLNNMLPRYTENIIFSPRLIEKWSTEEKEIFKNVFIGEFPRLDRLENINSLSEVMNIFKDIFKAKNNFLECSKYNLFKK
ncbi:SEC-C domain-containing protein [Clostridium baratii]|uniref:SEC-C domain-containing protein n=1 Tax=Clostridium baratii TaxID=1561 RepID=UPI0030CCE960